MSAARPIARGLFDVPLPSDAVFDDVERLTRNLVAMNGILRDRSCTSIRLVMNPDRMVVKEAMRTFTYLNLYGYLTDAVVVNRVFPDETAEGYFADWRAVQAEQLELVRSAFSPIPILTAPYFPREVIGAEMLDRLGDELFGARDAGELLYRELSQELSGDNGTGHAAAAASVRRARRHPAQEDRAGGGRPGRRPEADYHPAAHDGGLRNQRRPLRGRRARGLLREGRAWTRPRTTPPDPEPGFDWRPYASEEEWRDPRFGEGPPPPPRRRGALDFSALFVLLDAIRRAMPRDLRRAVRAADPRGAAHPALADRLVPGAPRPPAARAARRGHPDRLAAVSRCRSPGWSARPGASRVPRARRGGRRARRGRSRRAGT